MAQQQQAINAHAQNIAGMIAALPITDDQKDVLLSLNGYQHHTASIYQHSVQYQQAQVPSPLVSLDSARNINLAASHHNHVGARLTNFAEGPLHVGQVGPFDHILFVRQPLQVEMINNDTAPAPYDTIDLSNMITTITSVTGVSSCAVGNCDGASNLQGIAVKFKVHNPDGTRLRMVGFTTICRGHSQNSGLVRETTLVRGAQIYLIRN